MTERFAQASALTEQQTLEARGKKLAEYLRRDPHDIPISPETAHESAIVRSIIEAADR